MIPNTIVEDGQRDTNYFQHQPYLDNFNEEKGTHLVSVAGIHVEPMGIYGGKQSDLSPIEGYANSPSHLAVTAPSGRGPLPDRSVSGSLYEGAGKSVRI